MSELKAKPKKKEVLFSIDEELLIKLDALCKFYKLTRTYVLTHTIKDLVDGHEENKKETKGNQDEK